MRYRSISIIVLFVSLFGAATLQAQTEIDGWISGRIFDKETMEPVVRAYIVTTDSKHRAVSDQYGKFLITKLKPGEYSIEIFTFKYSTVRIERIIVIGDSVTVISQHLSKKTVFPDTIFVEYFEQRDIRAKQVGRISGTILDKKTLKPVVGVAVFIKGTHFGAISDYDGNFLIAAQLKAGKYKLGISSIGYLTETLDNVIVVEDSATKIIQYLVKDTIRLENVHVESGPRRIPKKY